MKRLLLFIPVVLAVALGVVLFAGIGKDPNKLESALIGKPVPEFQLPDLHDEGRELNRELFRGQVSLLNVWGTWCPACRDEHDDLVWLAEEKGIRIVGLNYKDNRDDALVWLDRLGDPYQVSIYDPRGRLGFDLGVYGAPETYVIDAEGIVRHRHVGVVNEKVWEQDIEPLVKRYRENI
ncbi:DsbE family thiol:disulfide interchange protein [Marinobacter orientalis]|uniref:DsbE family thiol:disulfide interchange protein n=1 Tax=Marinobacter orientalis TaxID=1928859 RepID=A0A7Y0REC3_9GAMM|nr:DsbE family thiol:disulfide interchange protein [Marinobacter orientalis]NMT64687.1 DsbE family thiol:disulfide interchange protein [Marinobacter orientalis]TGX48278.1 DsbE family thiol:disulfide interchange protein [Marinobacter orientalis]